VNACLVESLGLVNCCSQVFLAYSFPLSRFRVVGTVSEVERLVFNVFNQKHVNRVNADVPLHHATKDHSTQS
jgi:hypothetical protein